MPLAQLLAEVPHRVLAGPVDRPVDRVVLDSREVGPQSIFVAITGRRSDGHDFAPMLDCAAVVVERPVHARPGVTVVQVEDARAALAALSAAIHGHPSRALRLVGVTGTNGKTTTTFLLESIFRAAGLRTGVIGTTGNRIDGVLIPGRFTTPDAPEWQSLLARMRDAGVGAVAAEVSSIGLADRRVDNTRFAAAVYTNLTPDHLDVHGTMEAYADAKARLFLPELLDGVAVLNADDPACAAISTPQRWTFGLRGADLSPESLELGVRGSRGRIRSPRGRFTLDLPLLGEFNVRNALGAAGAALALDLPIGAVEEGLRSIPAVPGRLEGVPGEGPVVLVDYAHSEDALLTVIAALKPLVRGRLWVVFGCGGDRDRAKRPRMAAAASAADEVIATTDNPRSENPLAILDEMRPGLKQGARVIPDRAEAIAVAVKEAGPDDLVLIAGKGHETTQEIAGIKHPFDDRLVAAAARRERP